MGRDCVKEEPKDLKEGTNVNPENETTAKILRPGHGVKGWWQELRSFCATMPNILVDLRSSSYACFTVVHIPHSLQYDLSTEFTLYRIERFIVILDYFYVRFRGY